MAINRTNIAEHLEPGLNAIFGDEYGRYENEHAEIFDTETSQRAWEEELLWTGLGPAQVKAEGAAITYDTAQESWLARYQHETVALAFAITEEAVEDNLYDSVSQRLTKALARSMAHTKQVKAASILNNAFSSSYPGGDGKALLTTDHPTVGGGDFANEPSAATDLSETALEAMWIALAAYVDERGIPIAVQPRKLIIPPQLVFVAHRLLATELRVGTDLNDTNAIKNMGIFPDGYVVNHRLTDTDAWFVKTDVPDGLKHFIRRPLKTAMEGDFETGNMRYKADERYSFGWTNPRGLWGSPGA